MTNAISLRPRRYSDRSDIIIFLKIIEYTACPQISETTLKKVKNVGVEK